MLGLKRWSYKLFLQVSLEYIFLCELIIIAQLKVWNCVLKDVCLCVCLFDCVCRQRPGFRKIRKLVEEVYLILCVMICLLHI